MIHILTLSWNGLDKLKKLRVGLLDNLKKTGHDFVWHIRSNGCQDGTVEEIRTWEHVQLLAIGHNRNNFAHGVNSLVWQALGSSANSFSIFSNYAKFAENNSDDLLLLLNNDVEFNDDNSLSKMLNQLKPSVGMIGAKLLYNDSNKLQHAGVIFGEKYGKMPYHYRHQELSDTLAEKNRYFQAVTAAVCLVRLTDFLKVDGMDENYHWSFEDIDLCLKIGSLGQKIVYCGETKIYHQESASLKKNPVNKMFLQHNVAHFKKKWFGKYQLDHEKYLADPHYNEIHD